jgi:phage terminase large subunit-like protein
MSHVDDANSYISGVLSGKIPACKWIKLACQRQVDDLARQGDDWPYVFNPVMIDPDGVEYRPADRVCSLIELFPHTKGKWAAKQESIGLEPWQKFNITTLFGWVHRETGLRRFREAYEEIPRKNGKSILGAGIGHYMFAFDGEHGAEVYSGATTEKQAWEVFRPARLMAKRSPDYCDAKGISVNASNMAILEDGSRFEPLIGNPGDGASPSCAIIDEYHEHATDELVETMETGMGAREQPLLFVITTSGSNMSGPCYRKRDYATKVLMGQFANDQFFALIYTIDEGDDWTTVDALKKANPNFGVSVGEEYLIARQRVAMQSPSRQNAFKTKHLNIWVGSRNAWLNMQTWAAQPERKSEEELAGRPCFVGLDLASKIDVAALVLLFPPTAIDPLWHVHSRFYLPEDAVEEKAASNHSHYDAWAKQGFITLTPGAVIDYDEIMDDIRELSTRFAVQEIPFDPWQATQLATTMVKEGAPMVEFGATVKNFSEPMKQLEALVLQNKLAHGNNPVMTWMASNVTAQLDKKDNIYPTKDVPANKIDGMVALIMAVARAIFYEETKPASGIISL